MDRETVINIANKVYLSKENLNLTEIRNLLYDYYIEKGKANKDINKLLEFLINNPLFIRNCIESALEYYIIKFTIYRVFRPQNNILANQTSELLLIF